MNEELMERKILQRKRIRNFLIVVNALFFLVLVYDFISLIKNWW